MPASNYTNKPSSSRVKRKKKTGVKSSDKPKRNSSTTRKIAKTTASKSRASRKSVNSKSKKSVAKKKNFASAYSRSPIADGPKNPRPRKRLKSIRVTESGQLQALYMTILFLGITFLGLIVLLSASSVSSHYEFGDSLQMFRRQLVWALIGCVLFFVASRFDYRILSKYVYWAIGISLTLLVLVLIPNIGVNLKGSSRWLSIGPVVIQPEETAKFVLVIFTAHILTIRSKRIDRAELTVRPIMVMYLLFSFLLVLQPKLGTIILLGITIVAMLFVGGISFKMMLPWLATGAALFTIAIFQSTYARDRIEAFLDPIGNQQGTAYQIVQSQVAAASGGITGVGLGAGRAKYGFLPEVESDFIFSNLAEETGLIGSVSLICFYVLIAWFGLRAAMNAPDRFGMLLATGITVLIVSQAFLNIGVVLGVVPTTGITLPFISAGGSSLVMMLTAAGLLTNIARRSQLDSKLQRS